MSETGNKFFRLALKVVIITLALGIALIIGLFYK